MNYSSFLYFIFFISLFSNDLKVNLSAPLGQNKINLLNNKIDTIQYFSNNDFLSAIHFKRENTIQDLNISFIFIQNNKTILSVDTVLQTNINSLNQVFSINPELGVLKVLCKVNQKHYFEKKVFFIKKNQDRIIKINEIIFPTEFDGFSKREYVKNKIIIPNNLIYALQKLFKQQSEDDVYGYITIDIENLLNQDLTLIGTIDTEEHKAFFITRDKIDKHYDDVSLSNIKLRSKEKSYLRLPLYVDEDNISSGEYTFNLCIKLFATNDLLYEDKITIYCERKSLFEAYCFLLYLSFGFLGFFYLIKLYRTEILDFNLRIFTTIALFSSLNFVLTYAALFFENTFFSLFGPYKIFLTSIITEFISYLFIFTTVLLFPKKGIIALLFVIQYLLVTAFYSSFFLHQVIFLFFKIILFETIFTILRRLNISVLSFIFALALAVSDILIKHYILLESSILFRMYYADWYILSYVSIVGFFYTFIAIRLSRLLVKPIRNIIYYV